MYPCMRRCDAAATLVHCRDGDNAGRGVATAGGVAAARERAAFTVVYREYGEKAKHCELMDGIKASVILFKGRQRH